MIPGDDSDLGSPFTETADLVVLDAAVDGHNVHVSLGVVGDGRGQRHLPNQVTAVGVFEGQCCRVGPLGDNL